MEEKKKMSKNTKIAIIVAIGLAIVAAVFGIIYFVFRQQPTHGEKSITVKVVVGEVETIYHHITYAEYLRAALEEIDNLRVEGDESEYGLYIKKVNGYSADYETDGAYWALYTNDQYATNGVDSEPVVSGNTYSLKRESASPFTE